jgi:hypothetical protein
MRTKICGAAAVVAAGAVIGLASPAQAQQEGLVSVDVDVGVAANVAANICGVQVNAVVIAEQLSETWNLWPCARRGPRTRP